VSALPCRPAQAALSVQCAPSAVIVSVTREERAAPQNRQRVTGLGSRVTVAIVMGLLTAGAGRSCIV
jgi:hypothetical protein